MGTPGRQVISLSGDGGLAMLMGDLLTLRQCRLPVKVVVFNNSTLGFVPMEMQATVGQSLSTCTAPRSTPARRPPRPT